MSMTYTYILAGLFLIGAILLIAGISKKKRIFVITSVCILILSITLIVSLAAGLNTM
jgi:hypothetical protein